MILNKPFIPNFLGKQQFLIKILFIAFLFCFQKQKAIAQYENSYLSYADFYENLAPYGQWIEDETLGYVWSPDVEGAFRPYFTNGHWAMTEFGNTWVSDYMWGWACFHYGRWTFDSYYGWLWVPGSNWGPAWVMWRSIPGSFGWAPLSPGYVIKKGTNAIQDNYVCPKDWWVYIPAQYLYSGNYYSYWSGAKGNTIVLKNTVLIKNTYENDDKTYIPGPYAAQIKLVTKKPVEQFHLLPSNNLSTKVHLKEIRMYKPAEIKPTLEDGIKPIPQRLVKAPQPVTTKPQTINSLDGKTTPTFRVELPKLQQQKVIIPKVVHPKNDVPKIIAPQPVDAHPYEWVNMEPKDQPDTIDHLILRKTKPDHGPVQKMEPLPTPKHPPLKKLPEQPAQAPDPVKPEDHGIKK